MFYSALTASAGFNFKALLAGIKDEKKVTIKVKMVIFI